MGFNFSYKFNNGQYILVIEAECGIEPRAVAAHASTDGTAAAAAAAAVESSKRFHHTSTLAAHIS